MDQSPDLVNAAIQAAEEEGAQKVAGVLYSGQSTTGVLTSYGNGGVYDSSYYRMTVRAFVDPESSGQDIIAGRDLKNIEQKFLNTGHNAGKIASMAVNGTQGQAGKYDAILSPTVAGNIFGKCD